MYTLYIFDANRSVTAIPSAGYLGSYIGYVFGMYEPQAYTPLPSISPLRPKRFRVKGADGGSEYMCYLQ